MDWGIVVGIIGSVIGVGGILAARQYGNRRRKVMFEWTASPLVPAAERDTGSRLAVTYRDIEVKNPYLLTLRLVNVGPSDIASEHFDGGRSIVIDLGCQMFGTLARPRGDLVTTVEALGAPGVVRLSPGLLRRGDEYAVEVIVSGRPAPTLTCPLVNTDVVEPPALRAQLAGSVTLSFANGLLRVVLPGYAGALDGLRGARRSSPPEGQIGNSET
ncbi:hypothetical protein [Modestobacter sp. Leaf380]|uniref:hypothetical protein n=1 Tax=Modestobacter sp. Leaf380 TaxID=1736356 RepID=UPI0006F89262|nr:hypothetical protein [Modestobacter sp. Leaf380]KQS69065.1 hypothetical protein ASG41_22260 [Modestobacter sp. Leaf380]